MPNEETDKVLDLLTNKQSLEFSEDPARRSEAKTPFFLKY